MRALAVGAVGRAQQMADVGLAAMLADDRGHMQRSAGISQAECRGG
jgi:hypothetical protein